MVDVNQNKGSQTDFDTAKRDVSNTLQKEKRSATRALHDARDEVTQTASDLASETKDLAARKVEEAQHGIGASLTSLGGALRAAADHLAEKQQGTASELIQDTAEGIERLGSSLKDKPLEEVIGNMREFGRNNAGALIAGSALVGLALGRLVRTTGLTRSDDREAGTASQPVPSAEFPANGPSDSALAEPQTGARQL